MILQCPPIPDSLTVQCEPEPRALETNGDMARAYMDERDCRVMGNLRLQAVRELADCRAEYRP